MSYLSIDKVDNVLNFTVDDFVPSKTFDIVYVAEYLGGSLVEAPFHNTVVRKHGIKLGSRRLEVEASRT